ncbi:MAG: single-stranded DNA-binding protein [Oscillospiraceae bacterium]|nr:single-stranded DNA-binding protein [Oscillospiraceae bacterium]
MEHIINQIKLRGTMHTTPSFSHENHSKEFFRFFLEVERLSGVSDILPVIAEKSLLENTQVSHGSMLTVTGQVRSHNLRSDGKRHLLIFVFAQSIICEDGPCINECTLEGPICREPIYRKTPLGREICDVMLAVPRTFQRSDYLPCILWGKTAREAAQCHVREIIQINGRMQSRIYTKLTELGCESRTAYEISVLTAQIPATQED